MNTPIEDQPQGGDEQAALDALYGNTEPQPEPEALPAADAASADEQVAGGAPAEEPAEAQAPVAEGAADAAPIAPAPQTPAMPSEEFILKALEEHDRRKTEAAAPAREAAQEPTINDFLSEADVAAIDTALKEWPDVAGPMRALVEANTRLVEQRMLAQVQQLLQQQVAPVQQAIQQQAVQQQVSTFWGTVTAAHPDVTQATLETIQPQLQQWIATKPAYLQQAYNNALMSNDPGDAVALLNEFKASKAGAATPTAAPAAPQKPAVSPEVVAATAAVPKGKRQAATSAPDPSDEVSALAELYPQ